MSLALLRGRLVNLGRRVADALEFFPFTVLYLLGNAARAPDGATEAGATADAGATLPRVAMLWLARLAKQHAQGAIDVRLQLPREGAGTGVPDAFSVALAFRRVRSIELSWDGSAAAALGGEAERLPAGEFEAPLAAARDAQTHLKRFAGSAQVVLVNLPEAVAAPISELRLFRIDPAWGLTLHERIALVQAADAYIGTADELEAAALLSGRPVLSAPAATPARSSTNPGS